MEAVFKGATEWIALAVECAAVLVIAGAVLQATVRALMLFVARPPEPDAAKEALRLRLARWLAVALEFTLAADILRTAVAPGWEEIGKLAAIAALRTLLNVFLQREIEHHEDRHAAPGAGPGPGR
jgi:uncharacterized membrane protein